MSTLAINSQIAKEIIANNLYLTLATYAEGKLWASPVFYACNKQYNFFFISEYRSIHAQNTKRNPVISVAIFNSQELPEKVNGIQMIALCTQVGLSELPHALKTYFAKPHSDLLKSRIERHLHPKSYLGISRFRLYKIVPEKIFILDPDITESDQRIEVKL